MDRRTFVTALAGGLLGGLAGAPGPALAAPDLAASGLPSPDRFGPEPGIGEDYARRRRRRRRRSRRRGFRRRLYRLRARARSGGSPALPAATPARPRLRFD